MRRRGRLDERGVTPVVAKTLEAGLVVLFIALLTTTLFGGAVPQYRATAGDAVADRTLAAAVERVQQAVPPVSREVSVRLRVALPETIRGAGYEVRAEGRTLVLVHPDAAIGGRVPLTLPDSVVRVEGSWTSTSEAVVRVESTPGGLVVRLAEVEA
ncbi:DUF7266 family protein [Halomarina litorea]|uniref:DUF7266 family protein n=1 Tax=Halomarina litorea TaxID=2961595 RepID=UPI0020C3CD99|nr:hypothetical protein [Halomarina sp. BCD28]